jgi:hypothetical protein
LPANRQLSAGTGAAKTRSVRRKTAPCVTSESGICRRARQGEENFTSAVAPILGERSHRRKSALSEASVAARSRVKNSPENAAFLHDFRWNFAKQMLVKSSQDDTNLLRFNEIEAKRTKNAFG